MAPKDIALLAAERPLKVVVVGGSLSGLVCATILADLGHNVSVLEQTPRNLEHQAAGIATGPAMSTFLQRHDKSERPLSLPCEGILTVDTHDRTLSELHVIRRLCSWDALYYRLRWNFDGLQSPYNPEPPPPRDKGEALYYAGQRVKDVDVADDGSVTVHSEDVNTGQANKHLADLLVGADGPNSTVRQLSLGHVPERKYPGYILWRGVVREDRVSARARELFSSHFTFLKLEREYAVVYRIPGKDGALTPGDCLLNFAWYNYQSKSNLAEIMKDKTGRPHRYTMPIGMIRDDIWRQQQAVGNRVLSPAFAELMDAITKPFVQVITDASSPQAVFHKGRVLLVGDGLTLLRPHAGTGVQQLTVHCLELERVFRQEISMQEWEGKCLDMGHVNSLEAVAWGYFYMAGFMTWLVAAVKYRVALFWQRWKKRLF